MSVNTWGSVNSWNSGLAGDGFALLGTIKIPSLGGATSSNTPLLIKAAGLTTAMVNNLKADWGDLRLSADEAGLAQLPLDIIDTGLARTRLTNVAADELVRVWGKKPSAVKEIDTATYGKHNVYQDDIVRALLNESPSATANHYNNSAGGSDGTAVNSAQTNTTSKYGNNATDLNGTDEYIEFPVSGLGTSVTLSGWAKVDDLTRDNRFLALYDSAGSGGAANMCGVWMDTGGLGDGWAVTGRDTAFTAFNAGEDNADATTSWQHIAFVFTPSAVTVYVNGVQTATTAVTGTPITPNTNTLQIGKLWAIASYYSGSASDVRLANAGLSSDQINIEYQNLSANDGWWIAEDAANDLGTQGFTNLGTLKVPSLGGAIASNVPMLIKAAALTPNQSSNLKTDWGDLRISTDSAGLTQLPLDIVEGGSIAWTRLTNVAADEVIYVWGDKSSAVKEIDSATYGRNAVYQDSLINAKLLESSGATATDSAGNRNGTYHGALPTLGADFGQDFNGSADYVKFGNAALGIASAFTFSLKIKTGTIGTVQQLFACDDTTNSVRKWQWRIDADGKVRIISFDSGASIIVNSAGSTALSANTEYYLNFVWDGAAYKSYINGSEDYSFSSTTDIGDLSGSGFGASLGARQSAFSEIAEFFTGQAANLNVMAGNYKPSDQISIEYQNLSANDGWWISEDLTLAEQGFTKLNSDHASTGIVMPDLGGATATNVPLLIKAADLTASQLAGLKNDWGDLRLSTDLAGANILPLDVLQGGGKAWTVLDAAAGNIVYVWGSVPAATQPDVTDTYGRNAVWAGYKFASHDGGFTDSSGNRTATANGGVVGGGEVSNIGLATDFDGVGDYFSYDATQLLNTISTDYHIAIWFNSFATGASNEVLMGGCGSSNLRIARLNNGGVSFTSWNGTSTDYIVGASGQFVANEWNNVTLYREFNVTSELLLNNVSQGTAGGSNANVVSTLDVIGAWANTSSVITEFFKGKIGEVHVRESLPANVTSFNNITNSNQTASGAWWIAEGSGLDATITESGPSFTESISTSVTANITSTITELGPSFTEYVTASVAALSITASITETGPAFTESVTVDVSFTNLAAITETGPSFTESVNVSVFKDITATVTETGPSFTESMTVTVPVTVAGNYKYVTRVKSTTTSVRIRNNINTTRVK